MYTYTKGTDKCAALPWQVEGWLAVYHASQPARGLLACCAVLWPEAARATAVIRRPHFAHSLRDPTAGMCKSCPGSPACLPVSLGAASARISKARTKQPRRVGTRGTREAICKDAAKVRLPSHWQPWSSSVTCVVCLVPVHHAFGVPHNGPPHCVDPVLLLLV